jgi:transcriptional regulator with XRE-family HTH domain
MRYTMADRLKARCRQLGLNAAQVGEIAGVNRTFVYDIMRGKSANPNLAKLDRVAQALKVERNWLIHGMGEVQGEAPSTSRWTGVRIISNGRGLSKTSEQTRPICASCMSRATA